MPTDPAFLAVFGGACAVFILLVANIVIAAKTGEMSDRVNIAMYGLAVVVIIANIFRIYGSVTNTILAANAVALGCILVSLKRFLDSVRKKRDKQDDSDR